MDIAVHQWILWLHRAQASLSVRASGAAPRFSPLGPVERFIAVPRTRAMFETLRRCRNGMGCTRAVG